jgi:hypothetical protein
MELGMRRELVGIGLGFWDWDFGMMGSQIPSFSTYGPLPSSDKSSKTRLHLDSSTIKPSLCHAFIWSSIFRNAQHV